MLQARACKQVSDREGEGDTAHESTPRLGAQNPQSWLVESTGAHRTVIEKLMPRAFIRSLSSGYLIETNQHRTMERRTLFDLQQRDSMYAFFILFYFAAYFRISDCCLLHRFYFLKATYTHRMIDYNATRMCDHCVFLRRRKSASWPFPIRRTTQPGG